MDHDAQFREEFREAAESVHRGLVLLPRGARLVVGVSGGPDSMALLHLLLMDREEYGWKLQVAHVNHNLRGEESDADQSLVEAYCSDHDLPCAVQRATPPAKGTGLEEWGRNVRRAFFAELAEGEDSRVVLAHHARDLIETTLMHVGRGCGMAGLIGMRPLTPLKHTFIARPLLYLDADLREFCRSNEIAFREDRSNLDTRFLRNRLRHDLAGVRDAAVQDALIQRAGAAIVRVSKLLAQASEAMQDRAARLIADGTIISLQGMELVLRGEFLHHILHECGVFCSSRRMLEALAAKIDAPEPQWSMDIGGGMRFVRRYARWSIEPAVANVTQSFERTDEGWLGNGWRIVRSEQQVSDPASADAWTAYFAAGEWTDEISVRTRRTGDRIRLLGCGTRKVKKLFIEAKVPMEARETWPLVVQGEAVLWIPGLGRSDRFLLAREGGPAVVLRTERP